MQKLKRPPVFREDGTIEIHLTRGYVAIIDAEDAHLAQFNWSANVTPRGKVYGQRTADKVVISLHRAVMGLPPGREPEVDHKDGDGLNCRRENLREISVQGNRQNRRMPSNNTTGYVGVSFCKRDRIWRASIGIGNRRKKHLGTFPTAEAANAARLAAERELWGVHPQRAAAHQQTE